ncbi:hypothetical protein P7L68_04070 (plasmid) [Tistrella mobilis]
MQTTAMPVTTAPVDRGAWSRPELEVLSVDETALGAGAVDDGSGQS